MTILSMAIAHAEIPQVLNLGEILNHKEVVLVCLGLAVPGFAWTSQIGKLMDIVLYFTDSLRVGGLLGFDLCVLLVGL